MIDLIQTCSPQMQVPIAQAIIKTESGFNQFAIGVNKGGKTVKQPQTYQEAVATAKNLIARGANIDMGYAQINSNNLKWLGLSIEQVFEACTNLKAMQMVYLYCYNKAGNTGLGTRMQRALSCYNTGNFIKGFNNGYVNKTTNNLNYFVDRQKNYHQQYPQYNLKATQYIQLPKSQSMISTKKVEKTKHNNDLNKSRQVNTNAESIKQPVKVFFSWDVFKEF